MRVRGVIDDKTHRIKRLDMRANTFQEERILAYLVDAIEHNDQIAIIRDKSLQYVFNLNNARE